VTVRPAAPAVGLVGIGNMGLAMALRLHEAGFEVHVRDVDPAREALAAAAGLAVAATPAALAGRCGRLIVAVVDAVQTEAVLFGPDGVAAAAPGCDGVMLCPTIAPDDTERLALRLAAAGIACIDAPMSGGPARARAGQMSLMVACAEADFVAWSDLIGVLSSRVFRLGERIGDGARVKLVNNLLAGINLAGAAEALALAERVGLDAARALDVIEQSSGQSWIASDRMRRAIAGDLAPRAHTRLLDKDTHLALQMAAAAGLATPLGSAAAAAFARACDAGWADADDASLLEHLRRSGG
jgi:3-hydroxyisobutyrate dehydrogenase